MCRHFPWLTATEEVIFYAGTPAGKAFGIGLPVAILLTSVAVFCNKCGTRL